MPTMWNRFVTLAAGAALAAAAVAALPSTARAQLSPDQPGHDDARRIPSWVGAGRGHGGRFAGCPAQSSPLQQPSR